MCSNSGDPTLTFYEAEYACKSSQHGLYKYRCIVCALPNINNSWRERKRERKATELQTHQKGQSVYLVRKKALKTTANVDLEGSVARISLGFFAYHRQCFN
jgi:hypothetical protein